jgi:hypothetical protein
MPQEIRIWRIGDKGPEEIEKSGPTLEKNLHDWLEQDIEVISNDLLVIGREVMTDFGKSIDLLCLNSEGDIVIVELKRDRTPREVIAQVLEYASWVDELTYDRIVRIANSYLEARGKNLEEAFLQKFNKPLPEILNEHHSILIVSTGLDDQSERVINYLSKHRIDINAVTFNYFKDGDREYIARVLLITESMKEITRGAGRKKPKTWTPELLKEHFDKITDETLRRRLLEILDLSIKEGVFIRSITLYPQISLAVKNTGGRVFSVTMNGALYAYFGTFESEKFPTRDSQRAFVEGLKSLSLLPQDIDPDEVKSGRFLTRRLNEMTEDEFRGLLEVLRKYLT